VSDEEIRVHPAAAVFPMLSDDELADLAADIKANGLLHPIVLDRDEQIVDGRNRYAACMLANVEPEFVVLDHGVDVVAYVLSANIARRHLKPGQAAMLTVRLSLKTQSERQVASIAGVSQRRVHLARFVWDHAPELASQVEAGASLDAAYTLAVDQKRRRDEEALDNQQRLDYLECERARLLAAISAARTAIGEPVVVPPEPELTVDLAALAAPGELPDPAPRLGENLDREAGFLAVLQAIKADIAEVASGDPLDDAWFFEGHVMAVRSWASQVVAIVYGMVDRYNAALDGDGKLRRVK
jgi:ParB-like chromosome segregation protein Spo0J